MKTQPIQLLYVVQTNHLVKRHNVNPAAETDVFGVEAEDALLLKPLLRERIIGCQRGRQDGRYDERQDVETVEQDFVHGSLKAGVGVIGLPIRSNNIYDEQTAESTGSSTQKAFIHDVHSIFQLLPFCSNLVNTYL